MNNKLAEYFTEQRGITINYQDFNFPPETF